MKASADIGGAYRSIQRETGATGKELTGLKTAFDTVFKTVPASADDVATALSRITQTLDLTTKATGELAKQFLNLSRMTGTDLTTNINSASEAFNAWGDAIPDAGYALDAFYVISQNTGQSVSDISSTLALAAGPAKAAGLGYQETAIMVAQLGAAGVPTKQIISSLTAVVKDATTNNRSASTEWQNLINKFKDPSYKATADDMAILGTNTEKFANAARQGDLDFAPLLAKIKDSPDSINDMANKTGTLSDALTLLKNRATLALKPLGDSIFGVSKDIVKNLDPAMTVVEGLGKAFDKLPEPVKKATVVLGALAASSGPVLTIGGQLGSMLGPIIMNFGALLPVLIAVGIPLAVVGAAFGVLAVGLGIAYTASATFRGVLGTLTTAFQTFGGSVTKAITQLTSGDFQGALDTVRTAINQLVVDLSTIDWSSVGDKIQTEIAKAFSDQSSTLNKIADQLHKMIDAVPWGQLGQELGQGVGEMFSIGLGALTGTGKGIAPENLPGGVVPSEAAAQGVTQETWTKLSAPNAPSAGGMAGFEDAGGTAAASFIGGFEKGLTEGMGDIDWSAVIAALWAGLYAAGPKVLGKHSLTDLLLGAGAADPTTSGDTAIQDAIGRWWDNIVWPDPVAAVGKWWNEQVLPALGNLGKDATNLALNLVFNFPIIGPAIQLIWDFLKFIFEHFSTYVATLQFLTKGFEGIQTAWDTLKQIVSKTVSLTMQALGTAWDTAKTLLGSIVDKIVTLTKNALGTAWDTAKTLLGSIIDKTVTLLKNALGTAWDDAKTLLGSIIDKTVTLIMATAGDAWDRAKGLWDSIFNKTVTLTTDNVSTYSGNAAADSAVYVPLHQAQGGIVQAAEGYGVLKGPQLVLAGEAGDEAFIPLKGGKVPVSINVSGGSTMSIPSIGGRGSASTNSSTVQYNAYVTVDSENIKRKVFDAFRELEQYQQLR